MCTSFLCLSPSTGGSSLGQTPQALAGPYTPNRPPPAKEYRGTPAPPRRCWLADGSAACVPLSVLQHYPGESAGPAPVHVQQGVPGPANPGPRFYNLINHTPQYGPGFYSSGGRLLILNQWES